jgi:hypothetical protein
MSLDLYFIDVFWYGVIQRGRTDCVTIFLNVVAKGGTVILPLICAWPHRGCTI